MLDRLIPVMGGELVEKRAELDGPLRKEKGHKRKKTTPSRRSEQSKAERERIGAEITI